MMLFFLLYISAQFIYRILPLRVKTGHLKTITDPVTGDFSFVTQEVLKTNHLCKD